jgi:hypothetical protein
MSETKHTPGPWRDGISGNFRIYGPDGMGRHSGVVAEASPRTDHATRRANANLIAAAPDLFEAVTFVKKFLAKLEEQSEPGDPLRDMRRRFHAPLHDKLDKAIAKAEGR